MQFLEGEQRPYGFIMQKGTVMPHALKRESIPRRNHAQARRLDFPGRTPARATRAEALRAIIRRTPPERTIVIATTGYTGRELYALEDRPNQLYMVGSMGCASSFGLGLALARPDLQVVVVDGDGAALMRMGNLATIGTYAGPNLVHILLDNEAHDSTGAQATVSPNVQFADIAAACGYALACTGEGLALIDALFDAGEVNGPRFGHLKIRTGTLRDLPRPAVQPPEVLRRLMRHIGTTF
jgi:phosphonopyruvate decarboxylase